LVPVRLRDSGGGGGGGNGVVVGGAIVAPPTGGAEAVLVLVGARRLGPRRKLLLGRGGEVMLEPPCHEDTVYMGKRGKRKRV